MNAKTKSFWMGIASFFIVLLSMPLGHALMVLMDHTLKGSALHYAAFAMGAVGLLITIAGVIVKNETRQTICGLIGGLLFWTGWIEFGYVYYAHRYGVAPLIEDGVVVTKPEYLIMPSSFGFLAMMFLYYIFSVRSGCNFFNYLQRHLLGSRAKTIAVPQGVRNASIVTFMELNMILWTNYLLLLFCYDENFLGSHHPVTIFVAIGCLVGSFFMMRRLVKIPVWGRSLRFAIATVIVFWTFVEVLGRLNIMKEIWIHPLEYKVEMISILVSFLLAVGISAYVTLRRKK